MDYQRRVDQARKAMRQRGVDILVIGQPANRQYLSGFADSDESSQASNGWIVLTQSSGCFVSSFNSFELIRTSIPHLDAVKAPSRLFLALIEQIKSLAPGKVGIEETWFTVSLHRELVAALEGTRELVPIDGLIEELRALKSDEELDLIRRATRITDETYSDVVATLRAGQSEREIAWSIEKMLRERGADAIAFKTIVAAGTNSAVPHHESGDYRLAWGDPVTIDLGARVDGYCADLTRSFCLGEATPEYLSTWELVLKAQTAAIRGLRAGLETKQADAFARDIITAAGRGHEFGHGLGHGFGLMIHEAPLLAARSNERLQTGMVVTVEPGVYRANWGGVRLEDVAVIQPDGFLVLSQAPKVAVVTGMVP